MTRLVELNNRITEIDNETVELITEKEDHEAAVLNINTRLSELSVEKLNISEEISEIEYVESVTKDINTELAAEKVKADQALMEYNDITTTEQKLENMYIYKTFETLVHEGRPLPKDYYLKYKGVLYVTTEALTPRPDVPPNDASGPYDKVGESQVIQEFQEITGAHNIYYIGEEVNYNDHVWSCRGIGGLNYCDFAPGVVTSQWEDLGALQDVLVERGLAEPEPVEEELVPSEDGSYPVPESGAPGNHSGYKNPIGIYNGKNIYKWFVPSSTDYWTKGEQVKFTDENVYESIIEGANTWTPHAYPQGWKELGNFDVINGRGDE